MSFIAQKAAPAVIIVGVQYYQWNKFSFCVLILQVNYLQFSTKEIVKYHTNIQTDEDIYVQWNIMERLKNKIHTYLSQQYPIYHKWRAITVKPQWNSKLPSNKHTKSGLKGLAVEKYCSRTRRLEQDFQPDKGLTVGHVSYNTTVTGNLAAHRSWLTTPAKAKATTLQNIINCQSYRHL